MYTDCVKNITFSADETLIASAREVARAQNKTLNVAFREWLAEYSGQRDRAKEYRELMKRLGHIRVTRKFTRDELNSRD